MGHVARTEADYAQIELLLYQHKYDQALCILSDLLEKDPSDRQARLCRLLVMRILILRHLLGTQTIGMSARAVAIASHFSVRTLTFLAFRGPGGFQLVARLRKSVHSFPVWLDKQRFAIAARWPIHEPWPRNFRHRNRFQFIPRLCNSIGAFLSRFDKHCIAVRVAVPLALVVPVSVYVLTARHVETRPRLAARNATLDSASRPMAAGTKPRRGDDNSSKPSILVSVNSAPDQSSFHLLLKEPDDLNRSLLDLGSDALSSSVAADRQADEKEKTRLANVNDKHAVPRSVAKRFETSALKPASNEYKNRVADASKTIMASYQTKQAVVIRKSARFAARTIEKIPKGTTLEVLDVKNSWAEVVLRNYVNDNVTGFVRVEFLVSNAANSM